MAKLQNKIIEPSFKAGRMLKSCRAGVVIPVYDEEESLVMRLLDSFLLQDCGFEEFELMFVVNNSRAEAQKRSPAFLQNQKILSKLKFLAENHAQKSPDSAGLKSRKKIKSQGLNIRVVDASSALCAAKENNAGLARDIGGSLLAGRFMSVHAKERGIIALLDCDTRVSAGYISGMVQAFEQRKNLNGIAGFFAIELHPSIKNQKLFFQVYEAFARSKLWLGDGAKLNYQLHIKNKTHSSLKQFLITGQNMAVTVKAWKKVGGFSKWYLWEDYMFGKAIEQLNGEVAMAGNYYVTTLIRPSLRTGFNALGRSIDFISRQVNDFAAGKSKKILVPDQRRFNSAVSLILQKAIDSGRPAEFIAEVLKKFGFSDESNYSQKAEVLAKSLLRDCKLPPQKRTYRHFNRAIIEHLHPYAPTLDIAV